MNRFRSRKLMATLSLIAAGLLGVRSANAQATASTTDANTDQTVKLEKVIVTGSNIPMAADALSVPVAVVDFKVMDNSGVKADTLDILRKVAPNISGIGDENATIATGSNFGGASVNIKGLPTLVLINGRRVANDPAESTGGFQFVDLNMIPPAMIDRIEILEDGASAIYGSDAVGGVINVILKKDYNGWETGAHFGYSPNAGHYAERSGYLVGGVSTDKTSITVGLDYAQHDALYMFNRTYTNPIYGTYTFPGDLEVYNNTTGDDQFYVLAPGINAPPVTAGGQSIDQLVTAGVYVAQTPDQQFQTFNLAKYETLLQYIKRYSAMINVEHKIFGDNLVAFGDVLAAHTHTWSSLNAQPVVPYVLDPWVTVNVYGFDSYPPPAGVNYVATPSPGNPFSTSWLDQAGPNQVPESNPGYGDGSGFEVLARNRFIDNPRLYQNDSTLFRTTGGLRGDITENLRWEMAADLNRYTLNYTNPGLIDTNAFNDALLSGQINPFARVQAAGAFDGVIGTAFVNMLSTLSAFDFKIDGNLFDMPSGPLGFALGTNYVREGLSAVPDVNSLPNSTGTTAGWSNATTFQQFDAQRNFTSVFAEVNVPVTSAKQGIVGAHAINLDAAVRYDDYSGKVGSTTDPQVNLSWAPVDDQLKFRASAGKSFIAPQLYSLYGPVSSGSTDQINYTSINGAAKSAQFNQTGGSNPDLKPTTAKSWTAGFVYTPNAVKGLTVTVDYSDIKEKQIVGDVPAGTIIQSVETLGTASPYFNQVHYNTPTGATVSGTGGISSHSPQSIYVIANLVNLSGAIVDSTDINVDYKWSTATMGRFELTSVWTWYNSYELQQIPTEPYYQYTGQASQNAGTVPKWRTYTTLDWSYKGLDAVAGLTYVESVDDVGVGGDNPSPAVAVPSFTAIDLSLSYDLSTLHLNKWLDGLKVTVGGNNIFNKMPPLAVNAFPNTNSDVGTYDGAIGRFLYVDVSYKF